MCPQSHKQTGTPEELEEEEGEGEEDKGRKGGTEGNAKRADGGTDATNNAEFDTDVDGTRALVGMCALVFANAGTVAKNPCASG